MALSVSRIYRDSISSYRDYTSKENNNNIALQSLCIRVIVREFERYYLAFTNCDDPGLKRKLEFLQRAYTNEIAPMLYDGAWRKKVPRGFIDVFVNKYLKDLTSGWLRNYSLEESTAKFAELVDLESICFNYPMPFQNIIKCHLPKLQNVVFLSCNCNNDILKTIARFCPNIVEIHSAYSPGVTNAGMKYLCMKENEEVPCPKLKKLYIYGTRVMKRGIKHVVKNLRSLEIIDYPDIPRVLHLLHKYDLSALDKIEPYNFTNLDMLHLYNMLYFTEHLKICAYLCPRLKYLSCPISEEGHLDLISNFKELEKLHVKFPANSYVFPANSYFIISKLLKLIGQQLISLTIDHGSLPVSTIVKSCPCLTFLQLNIGNFQNNSHIPPFSDCTPTQPILPSKLEQIVIREFNSYPTEWKSDFLMCCASEYCPIKKICFIHSLVEMNFVQDILVNCHSLTGLSFSDCNINSHDGLELSKFAQVLPNSPKINCHDRLHWKIIYGNDIDLRNAKSLRKWKLEWFKHYYTIDDFGQLVEHEDMSDYEMDDDNDDDDEDYCTIEDDFV